jgi:hypothetical protein
MRDIVVKGEHIVHGIYITVIIILAIALVFRSSNGNDHYIEDESNEEVENTATMLKDASVTIIKNTNPKPSSTITVPNSNGGQSSNEQTNEEEEEPPEPEEEPPVEESELLPITGQISFFIDKITKEEKGEDWGKVTKIEFTIINQKPKSFYPKVLIYLWDDNDDSGTKTYVEEEIYFNKLESGKSITKEKDVSISFNEIDKEKTLKAMLYDEDDEELDIVIETFTLS